ncbi:MAG: mannosyltransferase [Thermoleophilaceae bacterium]|nr:mannosyltransferase [Thermoleophilaceae bacterium]
MAAAGRPRSSIWIGLGLAVVAAAAVRLPFLGTQSLWFDETFTRTVVRMPSIAGVWNQVKATEATPPLYYLLTWGWLKLFGSDSDGALRAVSALASVACVPAAFAAARRFVGDPAALATAAIAAVSPILVGHALEARAYSLLALLALVSIWTMGRVLERATPARFAAWALAAAAALWTHYFAAFVVGAEVCVLLRGLPAARLRTLGWSALVAALFAPVLTVLARQGDSQIAPAGSGSIFDRLWHATRELAMGANVPNAGLEGAGLALAVGGLAVGTAVALRRGGGARVPLALAAIAIGLPFLLSAAQVFNGAPHELFLARNLMMAWGCLAAVAALGLLRLRVVPLAAYLAVCLVAVLWSNSDWHYRNTDWRGAAQVLVPRATGRPIVAYPTFNTPVARRYLGRRVAHGAVAASDLWVLIEPGREAGRSLGPLPLPRLAAGFERVRELDYRGFRLLELRSARPLPVSVDSFGQDVHGQLPVVLAANG